MQINGVKSFLQLYETRNMTKASAQLYLTQQGLSRQIRMMEKELGEALFIRQRQGVIPTRLGQQLYPHFERMWAEYEAVMEKVQGQKEDKFYKLVAGFAYGSAQGIKMDFLLEYQKLHPETVIEIEEWSKETCIEKLQRDELDIGFLIEPFNKAQLRCEVIAWEYMYAAMYKSHPLATSTKPLDLKDLAQEQVITGAPDNILRQFFDYCCDLVHIKPKIIVSSGFNLDYVNAMGSDAGISTLTAAQVGKVTNPGIRVRQLVLPVEGNVYACMPVDGKNQKWAEQVIGFLLDSKQSPGLTTGPHKKHRA